MVLLLGDQSLPDCRTHVESGPPATKDANDPADGDTPSGLLAAGLGAPFTPTLGSDKRARKRGPKAPSHDDSFTLTDLTVPVDYGGEADRSLAAPWVWTTASL
jgi:hypothetical protein